MPVYIYSFDLPKGMPEVTDYFTEDNSGNTLNSGIWNRVYVGLVDCGISDQIFDCLNITRTLYLHLTWTDRMILHKVRGLFKGFCDTPYKEVREAIFSALYYLLYRSNSDTQLIRLVRECVDYDHGYFCDTDYFVFEKMIQEEDESGMTFDHVVVATPDWEDFEGTEEGQEMICQLLDEIADEKLFNLSSLSEMQLLEMESQKIEDIEYRESLEHEPKEEEGAEVKGRARFSYFTDKAMHEHLLILESECRRGGGAVLDQLAEWEGEISITHGKGIENVYRELCLLGLKVKEESFKREHNGRINKDKRKYQILF